MLERERLESKKISKTGAVTSMLPYPLPENDVHVGPSDYVPWLSDRKWCYVRMEGTTFGRRAAQPGSQTGSVGFAKLSGCDHRCGPLRQAGPGPRFGWSVNRSIRLLDENTPKTVQGLGGSRDGRGFYLRAKSGKRPNRMNSYQRLRSALEGKPVDQAPNFDIMMTFAAHFIGRSLSSYYLDYHTLVEANLACRKPSIGHSASDLRSIPGSSGFWNEG